MKGVKISIAGEEFLLFSICDEAEIKEILSKCRGRNTVFLSPSLSADFCVKMYSGGIESSSDNYAAAICSAAFLTSKRGMPLQDILFETPNGNVEVFCTSQGACRINIDKCKLLLSESANALGCDMKFNDVFVGERFRIAHTDDVSLIDEKGLAGLALNCSWLPRAVVFSQSKGGVLSVKYRSDFSIAPPTRLAVCAAAAYNERLTMGIPKLNLSFEGIKLDVEYSAVSVSVIPSFIEKG